MLRRKGTNILLLPLVNLCKQELEQLLERLRLDGGNELIARLLLLLLVVLVDFLQSQFPVQGLDLLHPLGIVAFTNSWKHQTQKNEHERRRSEKLRVRARQKRDRATRQNNTRRHSTCGEQRSDGGRTTPFVIVEPGQTESKEPVFG